MPRAEVRTLVPVFSVKYSACGDESRESEDNTILAESVRRTNIAVLLLSCQKVYKAMNGTNNP